MRLDRLNGLHVAVLGYGREGRSAFEVLQERCPNSGVFVWAEAGKVPAGRDSRIGPFDERLAEFDVVVRSPGIRTDHPALARYRHQGGQVVNPSSIFLAERPDLQVIGVTGSKGKSTTAALLAHVLAAAGQAVELAGNIGAPLLDFLDTRARLVVAELSSYQLSDLSGCLHLGLITRLFPEHLDWHGSRSAYFASKLRLVQLLNGNPLLINATDGPLVAATEGIRGRILANRPPAVHRRGDELWLENQRLLGAGQLPLPGRHNLDNAALALEAGRRLSLRAARLAAATLDFRPLPHRLELVGEAVGRRWFNDSIATSPYATRAALEVMTGRCVVLIVGGQNRPADWTPVAQWCRSHGNSLRGLVTVPDNGRGVAEQLRAAGALGKSPVRHANALLDAVDQAVLLSRPGDHVVLSPGAPSFPQFDNFERRGEAFRAKVLSYMERSTA